MMIHQIKELLKENEQLKEKLATKNSANIVLRNTYQGALREIAELKKTIKQKDRTIEEMVIYRK